MKYDELQQLIHQQKMSRNCKRMTDSAVSRSKFGHTGTI